MDDIQDTKLESDDPRHAKELEGLLKRVQADFENYKKFVEKEREEMAIRAKAAFAQKLLATVDEFEIALKHTHDEKEKETMLGMKMLHGNFMKALHSEGLQEIKCNGEKFDPYLHEAIRTQESDAGEGKIIEVVTKGYMFKDRVIRHSLVVVSSGNKKETQDPTLKTDVGEKNG